MTIQGNETTASLPADGGTPAEITTIRNRTVAIIVRVKAPFKWRWNTAGDAANAISGTSYVAFPAGVWVISAVGQAGKSLYIESETGGALANGLSYANINGTAL